MDSSAAPPTDAIPLPPAADASGDARYLAAVVEAQGAVAAAGLDSRAVMAVIVDRARSLTGADGAVIELAEGEEMVYRAACGTTAAHVGYRLAAATSLSGLCARTGQVLSCADAETDPRVDRAACRRIGARSMVVVPLTHDGKTAGVLKVIASRPGAFGDGDVRALRLMAGLLAAALCHAAAYDRSRTLLAERTAALDALRDAHAALRDAHEALRASEERFRCAVDQAATGMALVGLDGRWLKVNRSMCEIVGYAEPELLGLTFQDVTHPDDLGADLAHVRELLAGERRCYQMAKRYVHRAGHVVWSELSVSLVRDGGGRPLHFVVQVQDVTDRTRAEWLEEDRGRALEMVAADEPLDPVLTQLVSMVERQVPGAVASVLLLSDGSIRQWGPGLPPAVRAAVEGRAVSLAAALCAHAVGQEPPLTVSDIAADPAWAAVRAAAAAHGLRACWSVPVRSRDGTFLALLGVYAGEHRPPAAREVRVLATAAKLAAVALEHFHVARRLADLVRNDPLTGLANRRAFEDRLQNALGLARRRGGSAAVLTLDLDHFKAVNDTLGHHAGDALLQQVGQRLREAVRETDTVARLGGDEFAVLLPEVGGPDDAARVAAKLTGVLSAPYPVAGRDLRVTGSIGIGVYPADGEDSESVLKAADAALYRVKRQGRNGFEVAARAAPIVPDAPAPIHPNAQSHAA